MQRPLHFEDMRRYFKQPEGLHAHQCASMKRSLMVDIRGEVRLCFSMERLGLAPVGRVPGQGLREIWEGSREVANGMIGCGLECGMMLCHAR